MMLASFQVRMECALGNYNNFSILVCALPLNSHYCLFQSSSGDVSPSSPFYECFYELSVILPREDSWVRC